MRQYKPFLDPLDLTYTQYIAMMVLWENESIGAKELGDKLFLDSGTLTPLIKKMEAKGYKQFIAVEQASALMETSSGR